MASVCHVGECVVVRCEECTLLLHRSFCAEVPVPGQVVSFRCTSHLPPPTLLLFFLLSLSSPDANHPPHRSPPNFSDFTPHPWCRVFGMTAGVRRTHQRVVHSVSMVGGGLTLLHQGKVGKGASWCMVLGAWCMVHGVWCKELWCMVPQVEASCWWRRRNRSGELRVRVEVAVHWDRRGRVHLQGVGGRGLRRVACDPASMLVAQVGRDYHQHTTTTTLPHHHHHHHHPGINIFIDQSKCDYL